MFAIFAASTGFVLVAETLAMFVWPCSEALIAWATRVPSRP